MKQTSGLRRPRQHSSPAPCSSSRSGPGLRTLAAGLALALSALLPVGGAAAAPDGPANPAAPAASRAVEFPGNDGQAHRITWDDKSLKIDGKRLTVWSGEFHYWRLPSPDQWRDVLQKLKASG
ncbi:beta-galactosidase, partial [Streptomyces sp. NPDC058534]|uniref:beta-galactosidase n=1 Tax=Streptomyces sp. NPDC058534 TaxID=3346541 RepID=UPI00366926C2